MKRFLVFLLIFSIAIISTAFADYSPPLGMTFEGFISKYNSISTALESPLLTLKDPKEWRSYLLNRCASFKSDSKSSVSLLLYSSDPAKEKSLKLGLDEIRIQSKLSSDFPALITVACRCVSLFESGATSLAPYYVTKVISYYFENNLDGSGNMFPVYINSENQIILAFYAYGSDYYFLIKKYQ